MATQKRFDSFREAMVGVKPLPKSPERVPLTATPSTPPRAATHDVSRTPPLLASYDGERIESLAIGADPTLLHHLKQGKYRPQAELDAHGLNTEAAITQVSRLIQSAKDQKLQTLLIIHGRGLHSGPQGPVLRDEIVERLGNRHGADILAFCTAPNRWGGAGALLVRLRRRRAPNPRRPT